MLLRQKHFLPREPAEQQFLLKSSRAFARGLLPKKKTSQRAFTDNPAKTSPWLKEEGYPRY